MKIKLFAFVCILGLFSCQSDTSSTKVASPTDIATQIEELGKKMYNPNTNRLDNTIAAQFISSCEEFVKANPKSEESAGYLLKAGETARTMKNYTKGIALYERILAEYPDHPKAPQALFLKGFTLDNDMNQADQAKAIYEAFLAKHPNDEFADDTKFLLENLGKSDDEIIKSFEKVKTEAAQ